MTDTEKHFLEMTFDQYIQNPMGRSNAVLSNREMYRNMYATRLDAIMVREMGKINYFPYKAKDDKYFCHIKVPSETVEKFYYDVLIEFSPGKNTNTSGKTIKDYRARFYSNDPAFVYTFAHAFIKNKIFIDEYADKMSKEAVKSVAKIKNPRDTVGYVKSLFFAYLIMNRFNLFSKILYVNKYDAKYVKSTIMPADQKIALRQEAGQEVSTKEKRAKVAAAKKRRQEAEEKIPDSMRSKTSNKIRTTNIIGRKTSNIKTTGKTKRGGKRWT